MARTVIQTDDFNRASLGGNWLNLNTGSRGNVITDLSSVITGQYSASGGLGQNQCVARWVGAGTFTADQYSSLEITNLFDGSNYVIGVVVRASGDLNGARDYYELNLRRPAGWVAQILKVVNGVTTVLSTTADTWSVGDRIELEVEGSGTSTTLRAYKSGVIVSGLTVVDNSGSAINSGQPGVSITAVMTGDNWIGGSLATPAPTVTTHPSSTTVLEPAPGVFTAAFAGAPTSYAWEYADSPYSSWAAVTGGSGATTVTYTTAATIPGNSGRRFRCTATNSGGSVTTNGSAELTVTPLVAPSISVQPTNQSVIGPTAATFSLTASGTPSPTYQWQRNPGGNTAFADIPGAVSSSYTTPATAVTGGGANDGDTYRCNVTNTVSTITSNVVTLLVTAPIDATAPVMTGVLTESTITTTSYALAWSEATDNMSVAGYQLTLDNGTIWFPVGNVLSYSVTGRTPGSTDSCRVRAIDPAGNTSNELTKSVTLQSTTLTTDPLENLSGSLYLGVSTNYSWFPGGRIGSLAGITPIEGVGTTHATTGALIIPNLTLGSGVILTCVRSTDAASDGIHYQALTVTAV